MRGSNRFAIVSDVHYASTPEQARGPDYETSRASSPVRRWFLQTYRRLVWLREPLKKNYLLDAFLSRINAEFVIVNGDLSCDSGFIGVADDAAMQSAMECLAKLRSVFGDRLAVTWGDHDLGKKDFYGVTGGMRLESVRRLTCDLKAPAFWRHDFGRFVLVGIASSLVALDALASEILPGERDEWHRLREEHIQQVRALFSNLDPDQRVVLFCHDPTALPFLAQEEAVRSRLSQVERTIIGHLHSAFILKQSWRLAGMPEIRFLGHTVRKLSRALRQARTWKPFKVELCPSLAGMELFKDGGYGVLDLDDSTLRYVVQRLPRTPTGRVAHG